MTAFLSHKIKRSVFFLSFLVLVQHSVSVPDLVYDKFFVGQDLIGTMVQYFLGLELATVANPVFFIISGFLFFQNFELEVFWPKLTKRFFSLFIPFVLISVFGVLAANFISWWIDDPGFYYASFFQGQSWKEWWLAMARSTVTQQLWFIRDLMVYVLLAPVLLVVLRRWPKATFIWLLAVWLLDLNLFIVDTDNILFFPLGAYFALQKNWLEVKVSGQRIILVATLWLLLMLLKLHFTFNFLGSDFGLLLLHRVNLILGGFTFWQLMNYIPDKFALVPYYRFAIFVYLFQLPLLHVIWWLFDQFLPMMPQRELILFGLTPLTTFVALVLLGKTFLKKTPKFYAVVSGGR